MANNLEDRLAGLPEERRRLVERLLSQKRATQSQPAEVPAETPRDSPTAPETPLTFKRSTSHDGTKANYQQFYDGVTRQLSATPLGNFSFFLNYGYVANDSPQYARHDVPSHFMNGNSVKLVLELVGDCPIEGRRVLDVGCGRGGAITVVDHFFSPASLTGIDLSPQAVEFCQRTHKKPHIAFHQGDAENLPFEDASFDVVMNTESSHSYPSIHKFYRQVARVLAPGGHFLYTDLLPSAQWSESLGYLQLVGLVLEHDRDISANVLLSSDQIARQRMQAFGGGNEASLMQEFLATPGSQVYEDMRRGDLPYRMLRLRKPAGQQQKPGKGGTI